jgi:hypothetical protein
MRVSFKDLLLALSIIVLPSLASANDRTGSGTTGSISERPAVLTGKERLGRKWTDDQRIDNCNVPRAKRGPKLRSSSCAQAAPAK